jgi:uncharacterized protein (UPF0333 family)
MKIYILILLCVLIAGAYFSGRAIGHARCRAESAVSANAAAAQIQNNLIKIRGETDAETYNNGVADIRMRLRREYTIRD